MPTKPVAAPKPRVEAILSGAARAFAARGFAATSMREVAQATGASAGSIYHHFANKEDILRAIICGNFRRVQDSLDARLRGQTDARAMLGIFVDNHIGFFARHLDEMRVMSHELDTLEGEAGDEVRALRRAYTARAEKILQALQPTMSRGDVRTAALCLFGMLNWTYRWYHTLPSEVDEGKLASRMTSLFLAGFAP